MAVKDSPNLSSCQMQSPAVLIGGWRTRTYLETLPRTELPEPAWALGAHFSEHPALLTLLLSFPKIWFTVLACCIPQAYRYSLAVLFFKFAFYFLFQTLSSIFNIEMVKDKTGDEIKQVMNEDGLTYSKKMGALWTKSGSRKEHTFPDTSS